MPSKRQVCGGRVSRTLVLAPVVTAPPPSLYVDQGDVRKTWSEPGTGEIALRDFALEVNRSLAGTICSQEQRT
jgi:hypothetical protein